MPSIDTRGVITTPGGADDVLFDTSPFLDPDSVLPVLRFDTIIVSETTVLGDFFRYDRLDFVKYIDPFLPTVVAARSVWIAHLRFAGDPTVLEFLETQSMIKIEGFGIVEGGGVKDSFRFQNTSGVAWTDNSNDLTSEGGPNLRIELLELSYVGVPLNVVGVDKQVGKRTPPSEA